MIIVADARDITDGTASVLLQRIPTDIPMVLVSRTENYKFNEQLNTLKGKKYILVEFIEYGWNAPEKSHYWGVNTHEFDFMQGGEWAKLDEFISTNRPALTFKRELLKKDVNEVTFPIEYPNFQPEYPIETRSQYNARPIDVFFYWGRSSEYRLELHGNIWLNATKKGYSVCDNLSYFNNFMTEEKGRKWVTLWIPHYGRQPLETILYINGLSKLSVSLFGAGQKCFRTTGESPVNSLLVMQESNIAYSYEWVHGVNCIKFTDINPDVSTLNWALEQRHIDLYDIYVNSVKTVNKYRIEPYINNYILPTIAKCV